MTFDVITPNENRDKILYEIVQDDGTDSHFKFKFKDTKFDNVVLSIYGIKFIEDENETKANMQFEYDVFEGKILDEDVNEFKQLLGDFILQTIEEGLNKNDLVYTGGVDENRTDDIEQSGI